MLSEVNVPKGRQFCAWPSQPASIVCRRAWASIGVGFERRQTRTITCASLHSPFVFVSRAFKPLNPQFVSTMKKAVKKVKEKTGCFVDRLRIRSRSQSPAPVDRHLSPVSSAPPPPKLHAENLPQFSQRAVAESTAIQPHSPLTDDPMSPAQSTNEPGHNSLRVEPCTPLHPDPSAHTLSKVAHLSSNISLNQMPVRMSRV